MHPVLIGGDEWNLVVPQSYHDHEVLKIDDAKFFVCPLSHITPRSWEMLVLVNETTGGESGEIVHLPFPGSYLEQPAWYREAVKIKKSERNSTWYQDLCRERAKRETNHGE